jgi:hypothetical protein
MGDTPIHREGDAEGVYTLAPPAPFSRTILTPEYLEASRQAEARRIDALIAERQHDEREAAARQAQAAEEYAEAQLAGEKAAARRVFLLEHPDASEYTFEAYWKRVRPTVAEVQARQVTANVERLAQHYGRIL